MLSIVRNGQNKGEVANLISAFDKTGQNLFFFAVEF